MLRVLSFPRDNQKLINAVASAAKSPVIVVTLTATPLDLTSVLANSKVGAVLHVGQPSVQTLGIGDLLFGLRVPAGRTVQTVLPAAYADQISIFDFNMRPGPSTWPRPDCSLQPPSRCPLGTNPGRTYRFYTGTPVVPFGFGLSYTTFKYAFSKSPKEGELISLAPVSKVLEKAESEGRFFPSLDSMSAPLVQYEVNVTNTGNYDADHVVLGFITPPGAGTNGVPLKYLFGFERVHITRGTTVTVSLYPSFSDFTQVDKEGRRIAVPGEYSVQFGIPETDEYGQGFLSHNIKLI